MVAGCLVLGGGLIFYSFVTSPAGVYISHSLLGLSLGLVGVMVQTVLVSNWFRRKRGSAMGIVLTGTSFGGVLIPVIATPLISAYGWRSALQLLSLLVWLVLLPASLFLVKDKAADVGTSLDGDENPQPSNPEPTKVEGSTFREALGSPVFWIIAFCRCSYFLSDIHDQPAVQLVPAKYDRRI